MNLSVRRGEVRGLIGENGSGKSTISWIVTGTYKADSGKMEFMDKPYQPLNVVDASKQGICMIIQEQGTIETISVAANIFIGKEDMFSRNGLMNLGLMNAEAAKALKDVGVEHIHPEALTRTLNFEDRKFIEIARAFYMKPKLLIVDETTTTLSRNGRELLYSLMRRICDQGGSVLFISHDIDEVMDKSDAVTVLRDGVLTATLEKKDFSPDVIRNLMVGREIKSDYYRGDYDPKTGEEVALNCNHINYETLKNISFQLHKGEILGIGGLTECGMHELGRILYGVVSPESGEVTTGMGNRITSPSCAMKNGIGYLSKNRDREALVMSLSIRDNIALPSLDKLKNFGLIPNGRELAFSKRWAEQMNVKMSSVQQSCRQLSGGNKQKVVLAKWLGFDCDIFIMDCPTRGIDVGVKAAIYKLMTELKRQGKSILMISEELPELIGMSDRILILKDGVVAGEFLRSEQLSEQMLIEYMI